MKDHTVISSPMPYIATYKCGISFGTTDGLWKEKTLEHPVTVAKDAGSRGPLFELMDVSGVISADRVASSFGMSKTQLAETIGLARDSLYRTTRLRKIKTQARMREMLEIITRIAEWAGGKEQAMAWYRAQPIPAFGGRTAEALIKEGKAGAVRDYLDHVALGGFA